MINENKGIQSVERAMMILETIAAAGGEIRLVDLAAQSGLHKSTLHGLLNTLAAMGYIARRGTHYALGLRLREIAQPLNDADALLREAFAPAVYAPWLNALAKPVFSRHLAALANTSTWMPLKAPAACA
ncbi:helix-turn-helix domain-containing protein [Pseudomonas sp. VI4.1]|uniref:helix-turn-helix domain-containing protein n=1 Tax=Pseudomonas sp. VI4.1 TaxID=1941346 RepID=UPI002114D3EF|nr:helix-turn-helix domain-containing protein [Pseudomonas sp. VI4.1]